VWASTRASITWPTSPQPAEAVPGQLVLSPPIFERRDLDLVMDQGGDQSARSWWPLETDLKTPQPIFSDFCQMPGLGRQPRVVWITAAQEAVVIATLVRS
jgi:hypothetical protein